MPTWTPEMGEETLAETQAIMGLLGPEAINEWCITKDALGKLAGIRLTSIYANRLDRLIAEFEKIQAAGGGYLFMSDWLVEPIDVAIYHDLPEGITSLDAMEAHPCGTAACIAGKASLMPCFIEMGFSWRTLSQQPGASFAEEARKFFGNLLYWAVLTGSWCITNLHTIEQALLVLKDFRADIYRAWRVLRFRSNTFNPEWLPSPECQAAVLAIPYPTIKKFPASGMWYDTEIAEFQPWKDLPEAEEALQRYDT